MADIAYIGTAIAVVAATPATVDSSGFGALTWTATVGDLTKWGAQGDMSNSIDIPALSGRTTHVNGGLDGGEVEFEFQYTVADAGQVILRAQSNTSTTVSVRETHPDGKLVYYFGKVANVKYREKTQTTSKGQTGIIRVNSATVVV